ncbi:hypothetical protein NC652_021336 [Populus alba x Populus x berolinensis]|uniref:Uncharacterized protein n=1 Tax=Populus alba x Populus x berolinensis TaxID=444605 RepID=A0AAD6MM33_9ROSI|nr:hypothetical protein NC652_021336 [Populus alba x Populus x berolinensis]KAJ6988068.1 hypothetical protein NC653_021099 [Populus alba x Populus x berolinensis]
MFRVLLTLKFYSTSINLSSKEEEITNKFCSGDGKPCTVKHILVDTKGDLFIKEKQEEQTQNEEKKKNLLQIHEAKKKL